MKPKVVRTGKKGQASVEYLVILSIAIIIAVVAVGVLAGFIKIGTATTYKKKSMVYWKTADVGIADWEVFATAASQNSTVIFTNNKEYQITIDWVSIDWNLESQSGTTFAVSRTLIPGETYKYDATSPFNCTAGGTYSYEVTFQFDNNEHDVNDKIFQGVEKMTGSCSN